MPPRLLKMCDAPIVGRGRTLAIIAVMLVTLSAVAEDDGAQEGGAAKSGASNNGAEVTRPLFVDATEASGIDFAMTCGDKPSRHILEVDGGGVAFIDYDNDGDQDLFFANGATMADPEKGPGSRLYANDGKGGYRDVTAAVGIDLKRWAFGVAVGDYDADGRDDIYVTCFGPNVLLRNECRDDGTCRFVDVGAKAGVDDDRWGSSAAFGDIDGDGDLDLYVVNYLEFDPASPPDRRGMMFMGVPVMAGPAGLTPQHDVLYENLGDGRFKDVTEASQCRPASAGYGLVVSMFDFDKDGRQDIFVGNDSNANFLFHNRPDKSFEEIGLLSGIGCNFDGATQATMGIALADVDGNGYPDVFTTNFSSDTNTLHVNLGDGFFDDRTSQYGLAMVSRPYLSWGCGFYDFDVDGDEDLLISSGHVYPETASNPMDSDYLQPPLFFRCDGERFTRDVKASPILEKRFPGRATAFGDIDGDGDVDAIMTMLNDKVRVFRNESRAGITAVVSPMQKGGNRHALGAMVELSVDGRTQRRWIHGGSYQSVDQPAAFFGWPDKPDGDLTCRITWPDGVIEDIDGIRPGHLHVVERGAKPIRREELNKR